MKKLIACIIIVIISIGAIGCSSSNSNVIHVATNAYFEPYEYYENNEIKGIDIDIVNEIGRRLNKEIIIDDMNFDVIIPAITSGKCEIAIAAMTITDERKHIVNFTDSYTASVQKVIVHKDSDINSIDDLVNKQIGVQAGTTGCIYAKDDFGQANIQEYNNLYELVKALNDNKIDAIIIDEEPAKSALNDNENIKILDTSYAEEEYAIAIAKDNTELYQMINITLQEMKRDGTIDNIISKYINNK